PDPINPSLAVSQTLAELGYDNEQLTGVGSSTASYRFSMPPGAAISADAYFELVYSHSALVDYDRSGVVVTLNNRPIGSARFTDATASNSTNRLRAVIPPSTVLPGNNILAVNVNLVPMDVCSDPNFQELWAMVWSDSFLNLPLGIFPASAASALGLDTYPAPFSFDSTLGSSAFLLQKGNPEAWRAALQVASFLGDRANGALTTLGAFYADEIPAEEKANYNLLIVGQPSKLPVMAELNETLPAPFLDGSDIASQSNLQVTFRVPPSSPVGYLEMIPSPWNPDKVVLTIVGNSAAGIRSAGSALVDPILRPSLAGNFAVIDGIQILTGDTRLLPASPGAIPPASAASGAVPQTETIDVTPPTPVRPAWILPTMIVSIAFVLLVLIWLFVGERRNHRPRTRLKEN
ncbi:MAG: cellulose biosynthesis cyclic di-GMP-binding regulatory protein BcsB, partial [Anaerolineales bacterium]